VIKNKRHGLASGEQAMINGTNATQANADKLIGGCITVSIAALAAKNGRLTAEDRKCSMEKDLIPLVFCLLLPVFCLLFIFNRPNPLMPLLSLSFRIAFDCSSAR
jgi:hypothetical protein